jgi:Lrp/AsnC family transcriptional regulator
MTSNMVKIHQLDSLDRRIIAELQRDASLSHAELAERAGSSPASVWRRIRALETAGVLGASVRIVNADRVGYGVNVLCNVRMRSHLIEVRTGFEDFVRGRPEILECYSMSGDWDYLLRIVARDVADYEAFLMRALLGHPAVANASSHFALSVTKHTISLPLQ